MGHIELRSLVTEGSYIDFYHNGKSHSKVKVEKVAFDYNLGIKDGAIDMLAVLINNRTECVFIDDLYNFKIVDRNISPSLGLPTVVKTNITDPDKWVDTLFDF